MKSHFLLKKRVKKMPRIYESDFQNYIHPKYTIANEIKHIGEGVGREYFRKTSSVKSGEGLVDSAINIGKTALNFAKDNKELISAVGSIAGAASQISRAQESAQQLAAIQKIKDIRKQMSSSAASPASATSAPSSPAPAATTTSPEKIQQIKKNFSGRGVKKGGVLKRF